MRIGWKTGLAASFMLFAVLAGGASYAIEEQSKTLTTELLAKSVVSDTSGDVAQARRIVRRQDAAVAVTAGISEDIQNAVQVIDAADEELASKQCILPVKTIYQKPELPNGCEITSATIVLHYLGFSVSKTTMADTYLPKQFPYYNADPEVAYMGNPRTGQGWYCFTGPIVTAVNSYLSAVGDTRYTATDISGVSIEGLKEYIRGGHPIVFWATVGFKSIRHSYKFTLPNGQYPYTGLHCLVLKGYDENYMYIADPLGYTSKVSISTFTNIFKGMGSRAVLIAER